MHLDDADDGNLAAACRTIQDSLGQQGEGNPDWRPCMQDGDTFDDKAPISWISDGQTIKVLNLNTQKVLILKAKDFKKQESKSLYSYLTSQKYMSVRSFTPTDDDGANNRDGKNKMKNKKKNKSDDEKK